MEDEPSIEKLAAYFEVSVPVVIGRATISWNTLSRAIFGIYQVLSEMDEEAAKATFFVVQSDRSQRDMVSQLAATKLKPIDKRLAKDVNILLDSVNRLAGKRNDIAHVILEDDNHPMKVRQFHERGHLKGKEGEDLVQAIHDLTMDILNAAIEFMKLHGRILQLDQYQNQILAKALRQYSRNLSAEEWVNRAVFGLLDFPAASQLSDLDSPVT